VNGYGTGVEARWRRHFPCGGGSGLAPPGLPGHGVGVSEPSKPVVPPERLEKAIVGAIPHEYAGCTEEE